MVLLCCISLKSNIQFDKTLINKIVVKIFLKPKIKQFPQVPENTPHFFVCCGKTAERKFSSNYYGIPKAVYKLSFFICE